MSEAIASEARANNAVLLCCMLRGVAVTLCVSVMHLCVPEQSLKLLGFLGVLLLVCGHGSLPLLLSSGTLLDVGAHGVIHLRQEQTSTRTHATTTYNQPSLQGKLNLTVVAVQLPPRHSFRCICKVLLSPFSDEVSTCNNTPKYS
jgi:hypothetical protein